MCQVIQKDTIWIKFDLKCNGKFTDMILSVSDKINQLKMTCNLWKMWLTV